MLFLGLGSIGEKDPIMVFLSLAWIGKASSMVVWLLNLSPGLGERRYQVEVISGIGLGSGEIPALGKDSSSLWRVFLSRRYILALLGNLLPRMSQREFRVEKTWSFLPFYQRERPLFF